MSRQDTAGIMIAFAIVAAIAGFALYGTCTVSFGTFCLQYGYRDLGILALVFAGVLSVAGFVIYATGQPTLLPPTGVSPSVATCPVCGQTLAWVPAYNRGFCSQCGQYR